MNTYRKTRTARLVGIATLTFTCVSLLLPTQVGAVKSVVAGGRPIYIGQIVPLTGAFSMQRSSAGHVVGMAGTLLAARQINAHGGINGRPLKLVFADGRSTPAGCVIAFNKLVRSGWFAAIVGTGRSTDTLAMTPSIERAGIPVIIGGGLPKTTHIGNPWVFRTRPNDTYAAQALATFAANTLHVSKIALLYNDDVLGMEADRLLRTDLKALGISPVTEQAYPVLAHDLTAQVLAIKKSGATALIAWGEEPADFRLLALEMRQAGVHLTWLGNGILALAATLSGDSLLHGTYSATDYVAGQSPQATAFNRDFEAAFHHPAGFPEALTYDGIEILARVMRKVGTNPQAIRRGLLAVRGYRGAMGTYDFDRNGDGLHQYTIVRNVNGQLHLVTVLSF